MIDVDEAKMTRTEVLLILFGGVIGLGIIAVCLPQFAYVIARKAGAGWFSAKLDHHKRVLTEHEQICNDEEKHG